MPLYFDGVEEAERRLFRLHDDIVDRPFLLELAAYIVDKIDARTAKGVDYKGRPFKPYSRSYALFRAKTGHPTKRPDLFYSGSMLSSMTYTVDGSGGRIFFQNTQDRTGTPNPLKAYFLHQKRKFFAISNEDVEGMADILADHLRELTSDKG